MSVEGCVCATYNAHLLIFVTKQNLVGIDALISDMSICRPSGCTVVSGVVVVVVVSVCNRSQMRTSKCTCLIFGVSIVLDPD